MFWDIVNAITNGIKELATDVFSIFTKVGAVGAIVTLAVVGMFISFVIFNHVGLLSKSGSSDKVKNRGER